MKLFNSFLQKTISKNLLFYFWKEAYSFSNHQRNFANQHRSFAKPQRSLAKLHRWLITDKDKNEVCICISK